MSADLGELMVQPSTSAHRHYRGTWEVVRRTHCGIVLSGVHAKGDELKRISADANAAESLQRENAELKEQRDRWKAAWEQDNEKALSQSLREADVLIDAADKVEAMEAENAALRNAVRHYSGTDDVDEAVRVVRDLAQLEEDGRG